MQKIQLTMGQRQHLVRVFNDAFSEHPFYKQIGAVTKALYQEQIRAHFLPLSVVEEKLPPYPIIIHEKKDEEGNVVAADYEITLTLEFPFVRNGVNKIDLVRTVSREHLANVA